MESVDRRKLALQEVESDPTTVIELNSYQVSALEGFRDYVEVE